ncbi:peptidase S28 [Neoconidiobolus thromboides FSU 785]|nr:peptidase S28 [Neoconidiobolus thromboides FSU 785]
MKLYLSLLLLGCVVAVPKLTTLRVDDSILDQFNSRVSNAVAEQWFNQTLTHDGGKDSKVYWKQRYFVNDQFYKPGGPAFLFIGGEGELNGGWTQYSLIAKAAEKYNGVVYALEHRFYGVSYPKPDLTLGSLKYLTSELAIDDLAYFAKNIKLPQSKRLSYQTEKTKWILAGGSYPGNLAAWTRLKHPEVFHGAIASSAPVEAKEDFFEYDQQVQRSLAENGGKQCANYYVENFKAINKVLLKGTTQEKKALKDKFSCGDVADDAFGLALIYVSGTVQYNNNNRPGNVEEYCKTLKLNGTSTEKLNDFARDFKSRLSIYQCKDFVDYSYYKNTNKPSPTEAYRQWLYQSCTEFGYWQVAPHEGFDSARSQLLTVPYFRNLSCEFIFGPNGPKRPNIDETNRKYQGKNIKVDNVLFVNGDLDPWMPLSITKSTKSSMPSIVIKGASHCADLSSFNPTDTKEVTEAKGKVLAFLDELLV